jgi:hypothetical protein
MDVGKRSSVKGDASTRNGKFLSDRACISLTITHMRSAETVGMSMLCEFRFDLLDRGG